MDDYDVRGVRQEAATFRQILRDMNQAGMKMPGFINKIVSIQADIESTQKIGSSVNGWIDSLRRAKEEAGGVSEALAEFRRGLYDNSKFLQAHKRDRAVDEQLFKDTIKMARAAFAASAGGSAAKKQAALASIDQAEQVHRDRVDVEKFRESEAAAQRVLQELADSYKARGMSEAEANQRAQAEGRDQAEEAARAAAAEVEAKYKWVESTFKAARSAVDDGAAKYQGKGIIGPSDLGALKNDPRVRDYVRGKEIQFLWDLHERYIRWREWKQREWLLKLEQENRIVAMGIRQASELRTAQAKIEDDMFKRRVENTQKITDLAVSGTKSEIVLQERLMEIESQRLAMQKEAEVSRQKVSQAQERGKSAIDTANEMNAPRDELSKRTDLPSTVGMVLRGALSVGTFGIANLLFPSIGVYRTVQDSTGEAVDPSISKAADDASIFASGEARALASLMKVAALARKNAQAAIEADFTDIATAYNSFVDSVSSSQVGMLSESSKRAQDELETKFNNLMKTQSENSWKIQAGKIYSGTFEEAKASGALVWDKATKKYIFQNDEGKNVAVKNEAEFNRYVARRRGKSSGREAVALYKATTEQLDLLKQQAEIQKEKVKYEQAAVRLAQEVVKAQSEMLKNLKDQIQKNIESDTESMFGMDNRKTGEEFTEIMENRMDEERREQEALAYKGSPEGESEFRRQYNVEMALRKDMRKIDTKEQKETIDQEMRFKKEVHELELRNEQDMHRVQLQNAYNLFTAEQNYIKAQQDAFNRIVDAQIDLYGVGRSVSDRSFADTARESGKILISASAEHDRILTASEGENKKAAVQAVIDTAEQKKKSDLLTENQAKVHQLETEQLMAKYALERDLAMQEHELRIKLIEAEAKHKKDIEEAEKQDAKNNIAAMNDLYASNKEMVDHMADRTFGKGYDKLNDEEKEQLASQAIQQVQGAALKGLDWLKRNAGKNEEDYRDENGQLNIKKIKKDLAQAAENVSLDTIEGDGVSHIPDEVKVFGMPSNKPFDPSVVISRLPPRPPGGKTTQAPDYDRLHKSPHLLELSALNNLFSEDMSDEFIELGQANDRNLQNALSDSRKEFEDTFDWFRDKMDGIYKTSQKASVERENQLATLKAQNAMLEEEQNNEHKILSDLARNEIDRETTAKTHALSVEEKLKLTEYNSAMADIGQRENLAMESYKEIISATTGTQLAQATEKRKMKEEQLEESIALKNTQKAESEKRLAGVEDPFERERIQAKLNIEFARQSADLKAKHISQEVELNRRIGLETGTTMTSDALWDQIQASAFAHTEDPTVTAIESFNNSMDKNMKEAYGALAALSETEAKSCETEAKYLPQIVANTGRRFEGDSTVQQYVKVFAGGLKEGF